MLNRLLTLVALLLVVTGCGGGQSPDDRPLAWDDIRDAIPAQADALFLSRPDKQVSELLDRAGGSGLLDLARAAGVEQTLGFDPNDPAAMRRAGVDAEATSAVVVLTSGPIFIFKVSDEAAFAQTVKSVLARQPDLKPTTYRLAGAEFTRVPVSSDLSFDIGVKDGFAFGRVTVASMPGLTATDGDLRALFRGAGDASFWETGEGRALLADASGTEPQSVSFVRTRALTRLTDELVRYGNGTAGKLVPDSAPTAPYRDAAQRTMCREIVERMSATLPWMSVVTLSVANGATGGLAVQSKFRAQFSDRGAETWKAILQPTGAASLPGTEEALFYGAGHIDLRRFLGLFDAPAEAGSCPDTAKALALIGVAKSARQKQVEFNMKIASGEAAIALFGIRMAGMLPLVDAAVMLGAPVGKGVELAKQLQAEFKKRGADATSDLNSPYTRVNFRLLIYRFSLLQKDDHVAVTIGTVPEATLGAMLTGKADAEAPVADLHVNGGRIAATANELLGYYKEIGSLKPDDAKQAQQAVDALSWLERGDGSLAWSDTTLMGSVSFQLVPPAPVQVAPGEGDL